MRPWVLMGVVSGWTVGNTFNLSATFLPVAG